MAMKRVGVAELKDRLSSHLRAVEAGAEVEITDRDRPIARLVPIVRPADVQLRPPLRPFASLRRRRYPAVRLVVDSTTLLREEREAR